ncbi:hypothetical protein [Endozoicomonas sp. SCSIO W0465]|uniref:hypothetical protein n=1 Tax=Endozoicomonas sp. SCSIO W0465 TaxID=2918516 RepID=UPI0020763783|nr:hypothetical protein [Endozoicomonas sp. SCSIO W0465]USE36684.1 hypothetical protein MJO57_00070 [Endozoicomonas sp. SCSIO W0465]
MDTNNQFTASQVTAPFNPANLETDYKEVSLNNTGSAAGRPVAIVGPQASVKADTSFQEVSEPQQRKRSTTPSVPNQAYLPRQIIPVNIASTQSASIEIPVNTTTQSASVEIPLMGNPAPLNEGEQLQSLLSNLMANDYLEQSENRSSHYTVSVEEWVMDNPVSLNDTEQSLSQLSNFLTNFYREPSEDKFRALEKLIDQIFDQLIWQEGGMKIKLAFVVALISDKNNWPIQSSTCGELAYEILEGRSDWAKQINSNAVSPEKLDFWWSGFFATGEDKYLEKILKVIGDTSSHVEMPDSIRVTKKAAKWSFRSNCEQHQAVKDFALRMKNDNSLSDYQREYLRSITDSQLCNIL